MAHAAKYAAAAVGHLAAHYERRKDSKGEYVKFGNQDIDPTRTHLNYNLGPVRDCSQQQFIKKRLSEVSHAKRKDLIVMCSWVVTLPQKVESINDQPLPERDEISRLFFERCYGFIEQKYGRENIISSYVHRDETNNHMHAAFTPVMVDKKTGQEKFCAKDLVNRTALQRFHRELEKHLDSFGDIHYEVINEATKDGNREVADLKRETALQKTKEAELQLARIEKKLQPLREIEAAVELVPVAKKRILGRKTEVRVKTTDLDQLEQRAAAHAVLQPRVAELDEYKERLEFNRHVRSAEAIRIERLLEENRNLQAEVDKLRGESPSFQAEKTIKQLQNDLRAEQMHNSVIEERLDEAKDTISTLRAEVAKLEKKHSAKVSQLIKEHNREVAQLRSQLRERKKEKDISD